MRLVTSKSMSNFWDAANAVLALCRNRLARTNAERTISGACSEFVELDALSEVLAIVLLISAGREASS